MKKPTASTPLRPARGLECRHCGCRHFEVIYTRAVHGARIMRRRACRHCGRRVTTVEQVLGQSALPSRQP